MSKLRTGVVKLFRMLVLALALWSIYFALDFVRLWPPIPGNYNRNLDIEIHLNIDGEDLVVSKRLICHKQFKWDTGFGRYRTWSLDSLDFNYVHADGWGMRFELPDRPMDYCDADPKLDRLWFGDASFPTIYLLDNARSPKSIELYEPYPNVDRKDVSGGRVNTSNLFMTFDRKATLLHGRRTDQVLMGSVFSPEEETAGLVVPEECRGRLSSVALWPIDPAYAVEHKFGEVKFLPVPGSNLRRLFARGRIFDDPGSSRHLAELSPMSPRSQVATNMHYDKSKGVWIEDQSRRNFVVLTDPLADENLESNENKLKSVEVVESNRGERRIFEIQGVNVSYVGVKIYMGSSYWIYDPDSGRAWAITGYRISTNSCSNEN